MNDRIGREIELKPNTNEEVLPDYHRDFLYTGTRAYFNLQNNQCRWHWHKAVELFFIESGALEYVTSNGVVLLEAGDGGLVKSGVLHMTKLPEQRVSHCTQLVHLFDLTLITGHEGSRIDQKYVFPFVQYSKPDIIPLYKNNPKHSRILQKFEDSFLVSEQDMGYEIRLRSYLSDMMLDLVMLSEPCEEEVSVRRRKMDERIKGMLAYIHEHYGEKITIRELADFVFVSERECFRAFNAGVQMTPNEYIRKYRLQMASRMLSDSSESITNIAQSCGFGSSSFFSKTFKEEFNMTPLEYRNRKM